MAEKLLTFPDGFLWGTASSAYQVEGNNTNNQWWHFEEQSGAIWHGERSGLACNWWRSAEGDFDLMQAMGLNAHRLSIEWSRVEPQPGRFDHAAIDRYRALIGGLRQRGIEPWVNFWHFTNPLWFEAKGGWEAAESVATFQRYVHTLTQALADLCDHWLTLNEPLVYLSQVYYRGIWPPLGRPRWQAPAVFRHLLLAHAAAYHTIHAVQPQAQVGNAQPFRAFRPACAESTPDRLAAWLKRYLFEDLWLSATTDGRIRPPIGIGEYHHPLRNSADFIGINYYSQDRVRFTLNPFKLLGEEQYPVGVELSDPTREGRAYSALLPEGLYETIKRVSRLGIPIYITENGLPDADDDQRPRWLLAHLQAVHRAISEGHDVRGYFHWCFSDNFEWHEGWKLRFGLVEMDPQTQERMIRPSGRLYAKIARNNAIQLGSWFR